MGASAGRRLLRVTLFNGLLIPQVVWPLIPFDCPPEASGISYTCGIFLFSFHGDMPPPALTLILYLVSGRKNIYQILNWKCWCNCEVHLKPCFSKNKSVLQLNVAFNTFDCWKQSWLCVKFRGISWIWKVVRWLMGRIFGGFLLVFNLNETFYEIWAVN